MTCSLHDPKIRSMLQRLHAAADANDPAILETALKGPGVRVDSEIARLLSEAYIPVPPEAGQFLYILARGAAAKTVVEFGTSFGISTIYLAAAVRDNGGGIVITTEIEPAKARRAREHIREAGLAEYVEIREGDALVTLRTLDRPIDLLL